MKTYFYGILPGDLNQKNLQTSVPVRRVLLFDWIEYVKAESARKAVDSGRRPRTSYGIGTLKTHLETYAGKQGLGPIWLDEIDKAFCEGFIRYLDSARNLRIKDKKARKNLSVNTKNRLFASFESILNKAVRNELIEFNPAKKIDSSDKPKKVFTDRTFLTINEIRRLYAAPCLDQRIKDAFMFCCFCGLRWSDVKTLSWDNIRIDGTEWYIAKITVKTGKWIYNPIGQEARSFMPRNKKCREGLVFDLPGPAAANATIAKWVKAAGITKKVTFHTSRHTFATTMLTLGADIYTTSKLLGHSSITTTQIYARIVDQKKIQAVNLMNGLLKDYSQKNKYYKLKEK